ncbi:hypothetical protein AGMMS50218_16840 [Actinomycetota bacterium]|nr:hypothetical protein AGMMS50218_16840 [Actinomycetota bacterium]
MTSNRSNASATGRRVQVSGRPRRWAVAALVLAVVLATVAVVRASDAAAQLTAARTGWTGARTTLAEVADSGERAWRLSNGRVDDDGIRVDLRRTLDDAATQLAADVDDDTAALRAATSAATGTAADLERSTTAVLAARDTWVLARAREAFDAAHAGLADLVGQAGATLADSADRVLDQTTRTALDDALTAARVLVDAAVGRDDPAALRAGAVTLDAAARDLSAAVVAVTTAVDAWQAEQDRRAAEEAARAAVAGGTGGAGGVGSGGPRSRPAAPGGGSAGGAARSGGGAGGAGGSAGGRDGDYWVETESGFGSDLCGDTEGNSWEC